MIVTSILLIVGEIDPSVSRWTMRCVGNTNTPCAAQPIRCRRLLDMQQIQDVEAGNAARTDPDTCRRDQSDQEKRQD
jgi:hypothetical protein